MYILMIIKMSTKGSLSTRKKKVMESIKLLKMAQHIRESGRMIRGTGKGNIPLKMGATIKANGLMELDKVRELSLLAQATIIKEVGKITKKTALENNYKDQVTFIKDIL